MNILKEICPECSFEGMMLKLKLQYSVHLMRRLTHWKRLWCWEDWGQEEKGATKDEMAGWHHRLDECESAWTPRDGDGQGGLACCDSWGCKESDTTKRLNWTERIQCMYTYMYKYTQCVSWITQSCLTLYDPKDCSPPGSSVHGILQARILE